MNWRWQLRSSISDLLEPFEKPRGCGNAASSILEELVFPPGFLACKLRVSTMDYTSLLWRKRLAHQTMDDSTGRSTGKS
jgi:hypothetical protein